MKRLIIASALSLSALSIMAPTVSYAQSAPLTRSEVRADLIQYENAGYRPSANDPHYPADIQAAEAKIDSEQIVAQTATQSYGSSQAGSSSAGAPDLK